MFWICVLVRTYLCLISFSLFCIFVLGCGSSAPNEDIMRFRSRGEVIYPFCTFFLWNFSWNLFKFCKAFLGFAVVCAFLIGFWPLFAWLLLCIQVEYARWALVYSAIFAFHDNFTTHVWCCAYVVHLNIDVRCWYIEIFCLRAFYLVTWLSFFIHKKEKKKMHEKRA